MVQATASEPSLKMRSPWFSNGCPPPSARTEKSSAQQRIKPELAEVWQHSKDQLSDRIATLEQAVTAWQVDALTRQLRQQAKQEARALVGSLATFGLTKGSRLAHEIEHEYELRASR